MNIHKRRQRGITIIEFTIVCSTMLLIIFAIIELGVFTFNLQALNDVSRRTARIATVCPVSEGDLIKQLALQREPKPPNLGADNLTISYLTIDGSDADADGNGVFSSSEHGEIKFIHVQVDDYNYGFSGILRFLGQQGVITLPKFETVLAAESLGIERPNADGSGNTTSCK